MPTQKILKSTILAKSPWDTRKKHAQYWAFVKNASCKSVALFISHCFGDCPPPPPTPSNVESACNDSGCEGPFKSTLQWGWRGDARICGVFAKVSQDFWPGLSENPPFNKTLDNVPKLEYILSILEEITLRRIARSSVLPLAAWYCFCRDVVTGSPCLFVPRCHWFARELFSSQKL